MSAEKTHQCGIACGLGAHEYVLHRTQCEDMGFADCQHVKDKILFAPVLGPRNPCKYEQFEKIKRDNNSINDVYFLMCEKLLAKSGFQVQGRSDTEIEIIVPNSGHRLQLKYQNVSEEPSKNLRLFLNSHTLIWTGGFARQYHERLHGKFISFDMICEFLLENGFSVGSIYWDQHRAIEDMNRLACLIKDQIQMALSGSR